MPRYNDFFNHPWKDVPDEVFNRPAQSLCCWRDCRAAPVHHIISAPGVRSLDYVLRSTELVFGELHLDICDEHLKLFKVMVKEFRIMKFGKCEMGC